MQMNLNDVRSLNHRLLELLPHQPLKQFAGKRATTKAKAIEILLDKLKVKDIHDFVARNIYTCKQHVFLLSPKNGQTITKYCDLSAVDNEFKVISSDGTPPSCESTYLHKVTQSFISLEPLRKIELDFLLPIRVRQTANFIFIHFVTLERGTSLLDRKGSWRRQKTVSEQKTLETIVNMIQNIQASNFTRLDMNVGIKYLWDNDFIDTQSIQWRDSSGALTKSMDVGLYLKKNDPDKFKEAMENTLSGGTFHCLKDKDKLGESFTCDPTGGWIAFTSQSLIKSVDNVVESILQHN